ncbi:PAS domain-containing protein [Flagellimonas lutimaris]|uniref:PAS domain-containing protein n=1 Tax=Flagellimonas lutimaris TaxID=475082 RepID=UPI003F5CD738
MFPKPPSFDLSEDCIFDFSPHPMWIYDVKTLKFLKVNQEAVRLYGYTKKEFLSLTLESIRPKEDIPILTTAIKDIYQRDDGYFKKRLIRHKKKDGTVFPVHIKSNLIPHKDKTLELVIAIDITEPKKSEDLLILSNNRLNRAQRIAKLGYWRRNLESNIMEWSDETYRIFGYGPQTIEPTMKNMIKAFHPEDYQLLTKELLDRIRSGKLTSFEHRIRRGKDTLSWVHQEIQLVKCSKGTPMYLEGIIQDITDRKEHEQQLESSNERFSLAMLASNQKIWELDHANNTILHSIIIGDGQEQIVKESFTKESSWFSKIHPDDIDRVWESFGKQLSDTERSQGKLEYSILLKNGEVGYVIDTYYVQRGSQGEPIRTIGSMTDVTLTRKQLERIKDQNKALSDIAWLQSHAIRAPLTRIMALSNLYRSKGEDILSIDRLIQLIDEAVGEIDTELHKIIKITNDNNPNGQRNITGR